MRVVCCWTCVQQWDMVHSTGRCGADSVYAAHCHWAYEHLLWCCRRRRLRWSRRRLSAHHRGIFAVHWQFVACRFKIFYQFKKKFFKIRKNLFWLVQGRESQFRTQFWTFTLQFSSLHFVFELFKRHLWHTCTSRPMSALLTLQCCFLSMTNCIRTFVRNVRITTVSFLKFVNSMNF